MNPIIIQSREQDIECRGKYHLVYDYNGKIIELTDAVIWYSWDGNYVEPRSYTYYPFGYGKWNIFSIFTLCIED